MSDELNSQNGSGRSSLHELDPQGVRAVIRSGAYKSHTAGLALGRLQCNLVILPQLEADAFELYCRRNPRPCPLVGMSSAGDPGLPDLGEDIDIRTDVPQYNVYEHGELVDTVERIDALWRDDFVVFALGCSFTFEQALMRAGIRMRHIEADLTVPMFKTNLATEAAGPFSGPMVVSMRPIAREHVERATQISGRYPHAHGSPVHVGDPKAIGIHDLAHPDWGDALLPEGDECPVFWACGVTPQSAIANARPPLCITHRPGRMLITDLDDEAPTSAMNKAS